MTNYQPPTFGASAFNCPHCGAFAHQMFNGVLMRNQGGHAAQFPNAAGKFDGSRCANCNKVGIWHNGSLIFPNLSTAPLPSPDMPADIAIDYLEARDIVGRSPRGAAALLRLSIQKLCIHLGESGDKINEDIKAMVARGLPPGVQEALDTVRVIGNECVHPGELDIRDDQQTALILFKLVNFIVEKMITDPKVIREMYGTLPPNKLAGIANRDK
ncbi:DUF4145 domain-containing protein [Lacipirellula sp.]|uniref:DUF4145 domain-containing protein n=1 Tax=Lacipirellula sp. TaxID=2691419 RepID=UPI003D0B0611